jgi:hypothetical protein
MVLKKCDDGAFGPQRRSDALGKWGRTDDDGDIDYTITKCRFETPSRLFYHLNFDIGALSPELHQRSSEVSRRERSIESNTEATRFSTPGTTSRQD